MDLRQWRNILVDARAQLDVGEGYLEASTRAATAGADHPTELSPERITKAVDLPQVLVVGEESLAADVKVVPVGKYRRSPWVVFVLDLPALDESAVDLRFPVPGSSPGLAAIRCYPKRLR